MALHAIPFGSSLKQKTRKPVAARHALLARTRAPGTKKISTKLGGPSLCKLPVPVPVRSLLSGFHLSIAKAAPRAKPLPPSRTPLPLTLFYYFYFARPSSICPPVLFAPWNPFPHEPSRHRARESWARRSNRLNPPGGRPHLPTHHHHADEGRTKARSRVLFADGWLRRRRRSSNTALCQVGCCRLALWWWWWWLGSKASLLATPPFPLPWNYLPRRNAIWLLLPWRADSFPQQPPLLNKTPRSASRFRWWAAWRQIHVSAGRVRAETLGSKTQGAAVLEDVLGGLRLSRVGEQWAGSPAVGTLLTRSQLVGRGWNGRG